MLKLHRRNRPLQATSPLTESATHNRLEQAMPTASTDEFWSINEANLLNPPPGESYQLALDVFFQASHYVTMEGTVGPIHDHTYRLQVRCFCASLQHSECITIAYCALRDIIHQVAQAYDSCLLNDLPPFHRLQPTTEIFTGVLFQQIQRLLIPLNILLTSIELWESPTVSVAYHCTNSFTSLLNN